MEERLFKEIMIWREIDENTITRYRCFQVLPDDKFFVKGQDHFHYPIEETHVKSIDFYTLDSLFQGGLNMEENFHDSLEEAIAVFVKEFN